MPPRLPEPRLIDPGAVPTLRWGVIGTGIAGKFVTALHSHTAQRAVAAAARDAAKTQAFATEHGIGAVYPRQLCPDRKRRRRRHRPRAHLSS